MALFHGRVRMILIRGLVRHAVDGVDQELIAVTLLNKPEQNV
jgi:hypothetical protein